MSISSLGSMSPAGVYGAGAQGAALAVPSGAVAATPANLDSLVGSNPSGTDFALGDGTYVGLFSNKINNAYYGDPNDHTKVVFDGQVTYPDTNDGTQPNGGTDRMMVLNNNNILANMTVKKYRGLNDVAGNSPFGTSATGVLLQNMEMIDNFHSAYRFGSTNQTLRFITARFQGQYALAGSGTDQLAEHCFLEKNGDGNLVTRAVTPQFQNSNRGVSKFNHSTRIVIRDCKMSDYTDFAAGLWYDGNNTDALVEHNIFNDIGRHGCTFELMHSGIMRANTVVNCGTVLAAQIYRHAGLFINVGGVVTIENNSVESISGNSANGITLYQPTRDLEFSTPICGSIVRNNTIKGNYVNAWVAVNAVNLDGCNPIATPSELTIENNDEQGTGIQFWQNGVKTSAEWASLGYS